MQALLFGSELRRNIPSSIRRAELHESLCSTRIARSCARGTSLRGNDARAGCGRCGGMDFQSTDLTDPLERRIGDEVQHRGCFDADWQWLAPRGEAGGMGEKPRLRRRWFVDSHFGFHPFAIRVFGELRHRRADRSRHLLSGYHPCRAHGLVHGFVHAAAGDRHTAGQSEDGKCGSFDTVAGPGGWIFSDPGAHWLFLRDDGGAWDDGAKRVHVGADGNRTALRGSGAFVACSRTWHDGNSHEPVARKRRFAGIADFSDHRSAGDGLGGVVPGAPGRTHDRVPESPPLL